MEVGNVITNKVAFIYLETSSNKEKSNPDRPNINSLFNNNKITVFAKANNSHIKDGSSMEERINHYNNQLKKIRNFKSEIYCAKEIRSNLSIIRQRLKLSNN